MVDLSGKRVLITEASGVYRAWIADAFARVGAVLLLTDRDAARLPGRLAKAKAAAGSFVHAADMTDDAGLAGLRMRVDHRRDVDRFIRAGAASWAPSRQKRPSQQEADWLAKVCKAAHCHR